MRIVRYILVGREPVPCPDLLEWAHWYEQAHRDGRLQVARTEIGDRGCVSTIFLGLDHNYLSYADRRPILFETMAFSYPDWNGILQSRTSTWAEAEADHFTAVAMARAALEPSKAPS